MRDTTKDALQKAKEALENASTQCLREAVEMTSSRAQALSAARDLMGFADNIEHCMLNAAKYELCANSEPMAAQQPYEPKRGPAW